ncbi:riboflavin kinase / FMN adenylyltransferase [Butyrivibrio sp. TB]|nr:riboflavin kinase / FMN adenylyltransferase [Butyrivibrio sp. TB]
MSGSAWIARDKFRVYYIFTESRKTMEIIKDTTDFHIEGPSAIAIGKFDGIHKGHRKLLSDLIEEKNNGRKTVIFTFDPSPASFFAGHVVPGLTTREEKREWFLQNGIDVLIEFPMNEQTAATSPEEFVKRYLVDQMGAKYVAAGMDVSFGDKGRGDWKLLSALGKEYDFETHFIDKVELEGKEVSSTLIRQEVTNGNMEKVARLLGCPYTIHGVVSHGRALGRTIGIPTVNVIPSKEKLLPPNGVYYSVVHVGDKILRGMTNIGTKPTITDEDVVVSETYLYDFSGDLYDKDISVSLLSFKRPEMKFNSIDELKAQMSSDVENGRIYHHNMETSKHNWSE